MPDSPRHALMEAELRALAQDLDAELGEVDLSTAVTRQLVAPSSPTRLRERSRRRRLAVALIAAIAITATAATPAARKGVTNFLDIGTVRVHDKRPPGPVPSPTADLQLGDRTTLDAVRNRMPVVVPTVAGVRTPDEVWFGGAAGGGVSLVYRARPGLPAAAPTGVGLLIQEFAGKGRTVNKYLTSDTRTQAVAIGSDDGVFLSGGDHSVFYADAAGVDVVESGRLVGNALIFQRGPLTIRLEGDLPLARMVAIAASLH